MSRNTITNDYGKFAITPRRLIRDASVSANARTLYGIIWSYSDEAERGAFPGRRTLAADLGVSVDTVDRAIKELVAYGALAVDHGFDGDRQTSNIYRILVLPEVDSEAAPVRLGGRTGAAGEGRTHAADGGRTGAAQEEEPEEEEPEGSNSSSGAAGAAPRPELIALLDLLDELIVANGSKAPTRTKKNLDAVRLLIDRDGRRVDQVEACIRWCQADEFWRTNILSMSKLRERYDQLRLDAQRRPNPGMRMTNARRNLTTVERFRQAELENTPRQIGASA